MDDSSTAVLSARGDHHTANSLAPKGESRMDPGHAAEGAGRRDDIVARVSITTSPVAERWTVELAGCAVRELSHDTGWLPPHPTDAASTSETMRFEHRGSMR